MDEQQLLAEIQRLQEKNALLEKENAAWKAEVNRRTLSCSSNDDWSVDMDGNLNFEWYNRVTKKSIPYYEAIVKLRDVPDSFDIVTRAQLQQDELAERKRVLHHGTPWSQETSRSTGKVFWFNRQTKESIYADEAVVVLAEAGTTLHVESKIKMQETTRKRTLAEADVSSRLFVRDVADHLLKKHCVQIQYRQDECNACHLKNVNNCANWLTICSSSSKECTCSK
jgi:hypothetical protein